MTTTYRQRQVVLAEIPYTDEPDESKKRPNVIISSTKYNQRGDFCIVLPITGNLGVEEDGDVHVRGTEIGESGLKRPSIIKVGKPFTIETGRILRVYGTLPDNLFVQSVKGLLSAIGLPPKPK